jgi:hypothetical protein
VAVLPARVGQERQSMGLIALSLMLVVAAFEARSEKDTAFDTDIFNSSKMNLIAAAEVAGAFLITQANFMNHLLGTIQLTAAQLGVRSPRRRRAAPRLGGRQMDRAGEPTPSARPHRAGNQRVGNCT